MDYVKLTNKDCIHNDYQYKEGLNCLNGKFNNEKICCSGGLYFCRYEDIGKWIYYNKKLMHYIWDVELCKDSKIVDMGSKLKTDKFILKNKRIIWSNEEMCKLAVKRNGLYLQYVKPKVMNEEICKLAVNKNGLSLQYVKPEVMNKEICKLAVNKNGCALCYVKPELINEEICKLAVKNYGYALCYVKPEFMTKEIFKLAIQQNNYLLKFVDKKFKYFNKELMNEEIFKFNGIPNMY
jgi:galactose-1-phosphate uridylyltransferase